MILAKLALNAEVYADDNWTDGNRPAGKNIKFTVDGKGDERLGSYDRLCG